MNIQSASCSGSGSCSRRLTSLKLNRTVGPGYGPRLAESKDCKWLLPRRGRLASRKVVPAHLVSRSNSQHVLPFLQTSVGTPQGYPDRSDRQEIDRRLPSQKVPTAILDTVGTARQA